jgi:hypothetical protein
VQGLLLHLAARLVDLDLPRDLSIPLAAKLNEFMFFSSVRVRSSSLPSGRTETFTSKRIDPFSSSASERPSSTTVWRSSWRKRFAVSASWMSGVVTISTSGLPPRLKSTSVAVAPWMRPEAATCTFFAASSSRCARTMPIVTSPSAVGTTSLPFEQRGSSYWLIWYPFGRSG